jgi:hypothetical protein
MGFTTCLRVRGTENVVSAKPFPHMSSHA